MMLKFSNDLFDSLIRRAKNSPRSRQFFNIYQHHEEPCQRLLNAINVGSYIQPHRQVNSGKKEMLVAFMGKFAVIKFSEQGQLDDFTFFATEKYLDQETTTIGIELDCNCWHAVIAIKPNSVLLEIKAGPFDVSVAKDCSPWSPPTDSKGVDDYVRKLYGFCGITL
jgi:hypothetical protein